MDWNKFWFGMGALAYGRLKDDYKKSLTLIERKRYSEAIDILKSLENNSIWIEGEEFRIPKEEIWIARGRAELGLENFSEAIEFLTDAIDRIESIGFQDESMTEIDIRQQLSNLYFTRGEAFVELGNIPEGVSSLIHAFNTDNNNIEALFYIITVYAERDEIGSFDFYTKEITKCYNDNYSSHRKALHYHINYNQIILNNKIIYERFLRTLRSSSLIDDHSLHEKIGKPESHNTILSDEKQKILNEIIQDNISHAFDLILSASKNKPDIFNSTMLLFNNYNKTEMEVRIGIISKNDENLLLNRIKLAMIQLTNDL